MSYKIQINGRTFLIKGKFGSFSVYEGMQCLVFNIMTENDAENIAHRIAHEK